MEFSSDQFGLELYLCVILDLLPVASAASRGIAAGRLAPRRRGLQQPHDATGGIIALVGDDLDFENIARNSSRKNNNLAVDASQCGAAERHRCGLDAPGFDCRIHSQLL